MIKLIASDMDGTILQNGNRTVSEEIIAQIQRLTKSGKFFAPASGRQYTNLYRNFRQASKDLIFIAENGGFVKYKNEILYKNALERELGIEIMKDIYERDGCEILLSGENTCYIMPKSQEYTDHMINYVKNDVVVIKDFGEVKEDYIKVSAFDKNGIKPHIKYFEDRWGDKVCASVSGVCWQDFLPTGVHKGNAIRCIQKRFDISKEETMVFGDNYNDLEMFEEAYYSYCMESAADEVKKHARFTSETVDEIIKNLE